MGATNIGWMIDPSELWSTPAVALNVLMIPLATWAVAVYFVVMTALSSTSGRELGRFERRFLEPAPPRDFSAYRPWPRFRHLYLPSAQAAAQFQRRLLAPVWVLAVVSTLADLYFVAFLVSNLGNVAQMPWAVMALVVASGLPLLATLRFSKYLWRARASTEWQVAVAARRLEQAAEGVTGQDAVMARSAELEAILVRRFRPRSFSRRPVAEHRAWLLRLQLPIRLRSAAAVRGFESGGEWPAWVSRWLDSVAYAFAPSTEELSPLSADLLVPDHRTSDMIGLRTANWIGLGTGALGLTLLVSADHPLRVDVLLTGWDTIAGRASVTIAVVLGLLTLIGVKRSDVG
ncbi:hypothetical protein NY057_06925 [Curtobacterium flaccumfaciens]|uniref:hypothetical protein n=1 Tax=Curtobacterium flaccumfaciens TaxID=2035 RepID=UPI002207DB3F|nr:hypothetical protein [Curtobacterium flaccumfaciens]UWD83967.1 hypothetical protein NY057_06925 [Curtobacterium flaccumfaciens]